MVFGYRMELGDIVPSPNEAETVRYIYTRYLAGASFQCLANELNQKALPYHTGKSGGQPLCWSGSLSPDHIR